MYLKMHTPHMHAYKQQFLKHSYMYENIYIWLMTERNETPWLINNFKVRIFPVLKSIIIFNDAFRERSANNIFFKQTKIIATLSRKYNNDNNF